MFAVILFIVSMFGSSITFLPISHGASPSSPTITPTVTISRNLQGYYGNATIYLTNTIYSSEKNVGFSSRYQLNGLVNSSSGAEDIQEVPVPEPLGYGNSDYNLTSYNVNAVLTGSNIKFEGV